METCLTINQSSPSTTYKQVTCTITQSFITFTLLSHDDATFHDEDMRTREITFAKEDFAKVIETQALDVKGVKSTVKPRLDTYDSNPLPITIDYLEEYTSFETSYGTFSISIEDFETIRNLVRIHLERGTVL